MEEKLIFGASYYSALTFGRTQALQEILHTILSYCHWPANI